eukprot:Skav224182  [mRNA]  locus=scaffold1975:67668:67898:+ [translate_table: standard]
MERVRAAQAEGRDASEDHPGHLSNEEVEDRFRRLSARLQRIRRRVQSAQSKAGGSVQLPSEAIHPAARSTRRCWGN